MKRRPRKRASDPLDEIEFIGDEAKAIDARSGGRCEALTPVCSGKATMKHHIKLRGPGKGNRENGLHVCSRCHGFIHANVLWSRHHRMIVPSWGWGDATQVVTGCDIHCRVNHAVDI